MQMWLIYIKYILTQTYNNLEFDYLTFGKKNSNEKNGYVLSAMHSLPFDWMYSGCFRRHND